MVETLLNEIKRNAVTFSIFFLFFKLIFENMKNKKKKKEKKEKKREKTEKNKQTIRFSATRPFSRYYHKIGRKSS